MFIELKQRRKSVRRVRSVPDLEMWRPPGPSPAVAPPLPPYIFQLHVSDVGGTLRVHSMYPYEYTKFFVRLFERI